MKKTFASGWKTRLHAAMLAALCSVAAVAALPALAQETPAPVASEAAPASAPATGIETPALETPPAAGAEAPAPIEAGAASKVDKGDVAWMLTSTLLVLLMTLPGLALFYGGLVRSKNVLSVFIQVAITFSLLVVLWAVYGYSLAFSGEGAFIGNFDKLFLKGVTVDSLAATFSDGVALPEYVFIAFQSTFAGITGALIVGAFAERVRFAAALLFAVLWFTFGYLPIAHSVWATGGWLFEKGALDFAGGTVVHINAGVAGLVAAYFVGKRLGFGQTALKPHNVVFTFAGASLLWVGWFGFNAGSALEANSSAALAFINTLFATAAAAVAWTLLEAFGKGKPSALGAASGIVAGLVAITPAAGNVGPFGAIVLGAIASTASLWGVNGLKKLLKVDDTADVFGVHGVAGIVGAILTGVLYSPKFGGPGGEDFAILPQLLTQLVSVVFTIVWIAVVSVLALYIVKRVFGLRVAEDAEREGLDISAHGESAYES
ncbi:MAG: ammonium transporter [Lysobacteraceae bacterium]|nr:MAG: ammonium transporter [Xanthomonadaceae bacterium]